MLRQAHQGSFKHSELLLNYGFGRPMVVAQNLNVNADVSKSDLPIEEVRGELRKIEERMGLPPMKVDARGRSMDIEAVDARIEILLEQREEAKPKAPARLTEGSDSIQ